jgi:hypothetical protein
MCREGGWLIGPYHPVFWEKGTDFEKDPMRLPRFWQDCGRWNDMLVSLCILLALVSCGLLAWQLGSFQWAVAGVILAPLAGFGVGIILVHVLCTYFNIKNK